MQESARGGVRALQAAHVRILVASALETDLAKAPTLTNKQTTDAGLKATRARPLTQASFASLC